MGGRLLVALVMTVAACGSSPAVPADGGGTTPDGGCPGAYERVTAATSGHELAVAYREHSPTPPQRAVAAALWALLIRATHEGAIDHDLFGRLAPAASLAGLPALYPTAFRACGLGNNQQAIISDPFQCTDDCLISVAEVHALLVDPLVNGLKILGGLSHVLGESLQLTDALKSALADPATAGQPIEEAAVAAISQDDAGALLTTIFEAIGQSLAVSAAVVELAGAADVAAGIAAVGAIVALGVYASKLSALAARINACKAWKALNCRCMGPTCGCADLGESARGVMCCAQGGPTSDGGWYVNTASPTCCVLNRAEYSKHSEMCYTPPDKAPGRCPSCRGDADCCDRLGAEGNRDACIGGRCCGPDGTERPNTTTMVDFTCCSGVRYVVSSSTRTCAPAP